ncbi:hypothetical protein SAMN05421749_103459 [Acinetobacter marinus]|uniref:Uncharacterized protein n=1 Tax=Acinetobacter marinus TaxID=281375 RepID=A0A1G6JUM3_9GAMM|nr:hypothetical protein [Acinetobacter marinus]SDC22414.1 hypothetical protein SAMN05421749_103459 [Acinetobacter marinus]
MQHACELIVLKDDLTMSKDGAQDIHYDQGTLLKVLLVINDRVVVKSDNAHTFLLKTDDEDVLWAYM